MAKLQSDAATPTIFWWCEMSSCCNNKGEDRSLPQGDCCHGGYAPVAVTEKDVQIGLIGNPNAGKSTLFNALTGMHVKVANYPGVTVSRYNGKVPGTNLVVEDLPGTYSLDAISPDEAIVVDSVESDRFSAIVAVLDVTTLRRSLGMIAQLQQLDIPTVVALSFSDELARLGGSVDIPALERALGCAVLPVTQGNKSELDNLKIKLGDVASLPRPVIPAPLDPRELTEWTDSVLHAAGWVAPSSDSRTSRVDAVLLHPVWGTVIFFAIMYGFFEMIFTVAEPIKSLIEDSFGALGDLVRDVVSIDWLSGLLADGIIGGVGGVLTFLPQIALLFLMISIMEKTGYMARAAFLMDRVMGKAGLEGRAFVAMLSSLACAIPGIMSTRSLPSARDRLATMMTVPLMTCSARLPVYTLLIAMFVPSRWQGTVMFLMYLLGAVATMACAWVFKHWLAGKAETLPFYMHMPHYHLPTVKEVLSDTWMACWNFIKRVGGIILILTLILWVLLNLPVAHESAMLAAGVDITNDVEVTAYQLDHSLAADVGRFIQPIFAPLGFDWRITVGLLAAMGAREVFVATLGQMAYAVNPEEPLAELANMTWPDGHMLFTAGVVAALLVYFAFAMQCTATIATLHRESGSWKWPAFAFVYMTALAWIFAFVAKTVVDLVV